MEEKHQVPESMATVNIKPDYPPSEYCASEPPPAYHRSKSSAVQVAKIVAVTVVLVSFILGSFILASAYVTATASCRQLEQDLELLSEVADKFEESGNEGPLQPQALIQEDPKHNKRQTDALAASKKKIKDIDNNAVDSSDSSDSSSDEASKSDEDQKVRFKLPLQLNFDDLAGDLIAKNQKSKMNCIVEKKRAEEVVDHQPKTLRLPFGVNLTTDPRFERLTGERMVIVCESGNMQSAHPQPEKSQPEEEDDDDSEQDTIMIQPIMIPIPHTSFQTHMPQQLPPMQRPQQPQIQMSSYHPMEAMRPPMPPMRPQIEMRRPMDNMRPMMEQRPYMGQMRPVMEPMRPVMEPMRPPMRPPMDVRVEQGRPTIEQIIAFRQNAEPVRQSIEPQRSQEVEQERPQIMLMPHQVQIRVEAQQPENQQEVESSPNPIIQHIIQQIIAQKIMESQKAQEQETRPQESREQTFQNVRPVRPESPMAHGFPLPEEVLTQLNRLPNNERVIVAVSEPESSEEDSAEESGESREMAAPVQDPNQSAQSAQELNNRQAYMRRLPVNIPVNMMQQHVQEQEQEPQAVASEETRPHYVQPRSVSNEEPKSRVARSVNPLLPEKRVKRCACDCAC